MTRKLYLIGLVIAALLLMVGCTKMVTTQGVTEVFFDVGSFASTTYTQSQTATMVPVDASKWDMVDIQTSITGISPTQTYTLTPQFTVSGMKDCKYETYVNAQETMLYTAATSGTTSSPAYASISLVYYLSGATPTDLRALSIQGRCFRLTIQSSNSFTPTILLRYRNLK